MAVGGNILVRVVGQALAVSITLPSGRLPSVTVGGTAVTSMPYTISTDTTFVVADDNDLTVVATAGGQEVYRQSIRIAEGQNYVCTPTDSYISGKAAYVATVGATATIPSPASYGVIDLTLTAACTLTYPTPVAGRSFTLFLRQNQVGGFATTFPTTKWATGVAPTLSTTVTSGKQNLLTANQSDVETNTTGLTSAAYAATTLARSTAHYQVGSASASLTASGAGPVGVTTSTGTSGVAVTAYKTYTAVASVLAGTTVRSFATAIRWYDTDGTLISTSTGTAGNDNASTWAQKTVTAVAPEGACYAAVVVATAATPALNEVHYVDCLGIWEGSVVTWAVGGASAADAEVIEFRSDGTYWYGQRPVTVAGLDARYLGMPLALTGATAATRYVGATVSGNPASGTFAVGDLLVTQDGKVKVCTAASGQGTWVTQTVAADLNAYLLLTNSSPATVTGQVMHTGGLQTSLVTVPGDGTLAAGQAAIWLDATNAAGKLMVKAKTADGTVVTGSVTLS